MGSLVQLNDGTFLETRPVKDGKDGFLLSLIADDRTYEGIVSEDYLEEQSEHLKMDFETYLRETRAALTQPNDIDHECLLQVSASKVQLVWKKITAQEIKFHLGSVQLKKCSNSASTICEILSRCLAQIQALQGQVKSLETDNDRLSLERQKALQSLNKCVTAKEVLEKDLYSKFVLVLNSKKDKIRELEEQLQSEKASERDHHSPMAGCAKDCSDSDPEDREGLAVNNPGASRQNYSVSDDYDVETDEDDMSPAKKLILQNRKETDSILMLSEEEEEEEGSLKEVRPTQVARRSQRQRGAKKETPKKPMLPRVTSVGQEERLGRSGSRSSLCKSGSGTSNKSSDNLDPGDLIDNL